MTTTEVGIRELRDHLSRYIKAVRSGDEVIITAHGKPIARIESLTESPLESLIEAGVVRPPRRPPGAPGKRVKSRGSVSELVTADRR